MMRHDPARPRAAWSPPNGMHGSLCLEKALSWSSGSSDTVAGCLPSVSPIPCKDADIAATPTSVAAAQVHSSRQGRCSSTSQIYYGVNVARDRQSTAPCGSKLASFVSTLEASSLVHSALAHLEIAAQNKAKENGGDTRTVRFLSHESTFCGGIPTFCTAVAMLLALHRRSSRHDITEHDMLAMLWTLESFEDASRTSATQVLGDYVQYLAVFDVQRTEQMRQNWAPAFKHLRSTVTTAQAVFLKAIDWRVRVDAASFNEACGLLFGLDSPIGVRRVVADVKWYVSCCVPTASGEPHSEDVHTTLHAASWEDPVICGTVHKRRRVGELSIKL
jgi:hypothetical protein